MDRVNVIIIGGGVVGCALAAEISQKYSDVFVLESLPRVGMGASTRNSGVIHSGLYYTPGSLKARLCVEGNRLTYEFCAAHGVPHKRTGKLIVAAAREEEPELAALVKCGEVNGVEGLRVVDAVAIRGREPHIAGTAAIEVPSAGILSSEDLVKAYARVAVERGANIVTHAKVERLEPAADCIRVTSSAGEIDARVVVNSAGLFSDEVAAMPEPGAPPRYKIYPVRGDYCELVRAKSQLVNSLVYPLPHAHRLSLGVHFTKTLWGTVLLGPTARYVTDKNDYESGRESVEAFAEGARRLLPEITAADLLPAYSGIRAKLAAPGEAARDFVIERDAQHPRMINLIGIESPGLTSAPAIAKHVARMIGEMLR